MTSWVELWGARAVPAVVWVGKAPTPPVAVALVVLFAAAAGLIRLRSARGKQSRLSGASGALALIVLGVVLLVGGVVAALGGDIPTLVLAVLMGALAGGWGLWLLRRASARPPLGTRFVSEAEIRDQLEEHGPAGRALRRVDRTFSTPAQDGQALDRALDDGWCVARAPDEWASARGGAPDSAAREVVWHFDERPALVVAWWAADEDTAVQAAAYAWDDDEAHRCERALDEVGRRLGRGWRPTGTQMRSEPWGLGKASRG